MTPTFLASLSTTQFAIVSPTAVQRACDRWRSAPVGGGTGPYMFKEWHHWDSILLERNPNCFVAMNTHWGLFKDIRVRQAMNYAVNKKAILASVLFDLGTVSDSLCPP